ncbi:MAG: tetratricopeptide repeat protein [Acidobacteria bacterium]|nr:tetratricopeptide repeat protein [Acidobacteriota bacterium]
MSEDKNNFFKTNREPLVFTALSLLVLIIYWQTTGFGFLNLDDNQYVYSNPAVLSGLNWNSFKWAWTAYYSANWHPLTWLSHMLDVKMFGLNAGGHHAVNIVLHLANTVLAFVVFRRLTGCFWKSAIVAALFAVHPAHVESVAWVAERKDVLSTLFWLLTMWAYARYASEEDGEKGRKGERETIEDAGKNSEERKADGLEADDSKENTVSPSPFLPFSLSFLNKSYLLVALLLALGLTAKPMLVTLPFVLLLLDFWPLGRLRGVGELPALLLEKIPLFLLSAASSLITIRAQSTVGAIETLDYLPFGTRILNTLAAYAKYVATFFYPAKLAVWYPYPKEFPVWQIGGAILLLGAVTALCVWQIRERKYLLTGWLWFLGTLVPVIGLVQVGSQAMADRYTYVPYFGLFIMLVWGLGDLFNLFPRRSLAFFGFFGLAVAGFTVASFFQTARWHDNETLYRHTLAVTGDNFLIAHNLCYTLVIADRLDEAEPLCNDSIRIKPDYYEGHNTLGILAIKRGQFAEAESRFQEVLRINPNFTLALVNLSVAQSLGGKPDDAEKNLEKAVKLNADSVQPEVWINALNDLASAYADQKNYQKAAENLTRVLVLDQNNADARANLSLMLYHLERYDEAQKLIETAIQLNPNMPAAYNTYGLILLRLNRRTEAAGLFEKALQLKPDSAEAKENLEKARKPN